MASLIEKLPRSGTILIDAIKDEHGAGFVKLAGVLKKLTRNTSLVLAGLLVGSIANSALAQRNKPNVKGIKLAG